MTPAHGILDVRDLCVEADTRSGPVVIVDRLSLAIEAGQTVGLVGESGSGKSMTALAILRLLGSGARLSSGQVLLEGVDLAALSPKQMRGIRGGKVGMVFQEPMTALDPAYSVGEQIAEGIRAHRGLSRKEASGQAVAMLDRVGIPAAARRAKDYPHEFSGGMRQRVVIAIALASEPALLLADEPTTALDVTVQDQILGLLKDLQAERDLAILLISHDLGVIADMADRVDVMYAGQVVESADVLSLFAHAEHPYTEALLRSVPSGPGRRLEAIPGQVPTFDRLPEGCRFEPRCQLAHQECRAPGLDLHTVQPAHDARCVSPSSRRG